MWDTIPCSDRWGILRIQSGADGVWENTLKNIYHDNIPKNVDHVDDCVRVNVSVSDDSPMTGNPKHRVRYSNVVRRVMRKQ